MEKKKTTGTFAPDYGNWVSAKLLRMFAGVLAVCLAALAATFLPGVPGSIGCGWLWAVRATLALLCCATAAMLGLFGRAHHAFAQGLSAHIVDYVAGKLDTGMSGRVLDIGCGSGALSVAVAKRCTAAQVTGIDYWGPRWGYGKQQCERNATLEGVSRRTTFMQGDAAALPFADGSFDAAVSNFVFHEVKTQPDKKQVIAEALRVVKPGGWFAFHDLFYDTGIYGDTAALETYLSTLASDIHLMPTAGETGVPPFLRNRLFLKHTGLVYGRK